MEAYLWILSLPSLCVIGLLGCLMHFFKKQIRGETLVEITSYFANHFKSTFVAVVTTLVAVVSYYFLLATGQMADVLTVFGIGYMFDSTFNKWDTPSNS